MPKIPELAMPMARNEPPRPRSATTRSGSSGCATRRSSATNFYGERYAYGALVPALATRRFNVSGLGGGPGI